MQRPQIISALGQATLYAVFGGVIALFSGWPEFTALPPDQGQLTVSVSHLGKRLQPCEEIGAEELARLPPNMRAATRCPRERAPLRLEIDIDGEAVLSGTAQSTGLSRDGAASFYRRIPLKAGRYQIAVRLRDSPREQGFDYVLESVLSLRPAQIAVVDFDATTGQVVLR